ncbi:MAG: hypothetical protein GY863_00470 [bacterium]|nr:hypothetical protein [bacterium]
MKSKTAIFGFIILFLLISSNMLLAQDEDLYPGGRYDDSIPTPYSVLGHRFGAIHTFQYEMVDYMEVLEESSDRVQVINYGKTYQGRDLILVVIGSPENLRRLEEIKSANKRLTDPRVTSEAEANEIAGWMPSIVWLGYNIHGNETSGMEAAIRTAYQLTAGTDETTMNIMNNILTVIDPCQNPDGHDRFTHYSRSVVTVKSHPQSQDVEHNSPWPGGRTNHYLFDLNRDFFLKTQIESWQKAIVYHQFMPHVFPDIHEMGTNSTYFFAPPMDPYNEYVTPLLHKWWNIIAQGNAESFDHFGWGYYTKESFDAFYPGYGVSYPSINGSIGMTYEEASARGVSSMRADGTVLTLREASWHQFTTSMATLKTISERREERVKDFYQFFVDAMESAKSDEMKEIILVPDRDPHIAAKLVENLLVEEVEIKVAKEPFTLNATSYFTKSSESKTFPAGSYIISLNQPQKVLIKTLIGPEAKIEDYFIEEERQRREDRERSHFYDITAWSMPLTYGVDAYWTDRESRTDADMINEAPEFTGSVIGGRAKQVYLIPYNTFSSTKLLFELIDQGFRARMSRKAFTIDGKTWPVGTIVVRINRNGADNPHFSVHEAVKGLTKKYGIDAYAMHSGLSSEGIDPGSNNVVPVIKPEIAIVTESPVSSYSYGAMHYLFEREMGLSFTRINASDLANLDDYNVVVLPSGNYGRALNENQLNEFKRWVRRGGTVVAVSGAVNWLKNAKMSAIKGLNGTPDPDDKSKNIQVDYTPGAIVKVKMNPLSFMSYGVPEEVAVFLRSSNIYKTFPDDKFKNIGIFASAEEVKLSGFIWPETEKYLAGNGWLFQESFGRGKVISFVEDPVFRASYDGLNKVLFNAIILGPSFR